MGKESVWPGMDLAPLRRSIAAGRQLFSRGKMPKRPSATDPTIHSSRLPSNCLYLLSTLLTHHHRLRTFDNSSVALRLRDIAGGLCCILSTPTFARLPPPYHRQQAITTVRSSALVYLHHFTPDRPPSHRIPHTCVASNSWSVGFDCLSCPTPTFWAGPSIR